MRAPEIRVLSNYTGGFHGNDIDEIKERLYYQLKHPVLWDANLQSAVGEGIGRIYEFGGGIGTGTPEEKRPNLEGMIKKAVRSLDPRPDYVPAINRETLEAID